jgi:hypothetical protein
MAIADFILAWAAVAAMLYFCTWLLRSPTEQRFARGIYTGDQVVAGTSTTRPGSKSRFGCMGM